MSAAVHRDIALRGIIANEKKKKKPVGPLAVRLTFGLCFGFTAWNLSGPGKKG